MMLSHMTTRFDVSLEDDQAAEVRREAAERGQSISALIRGRIGYEPAPYRFTGLMGESFIRDLAAVQGWRSGERVEIDAAMDRLRKFDRWSADHPLMFATQTTTTAAAIIPPGYRNAVSVAMTIDRPLASACANAPIDNAAPFSVPTAGGDGTIHAARAEGSQPAGSDPTFGTATMSPAGLAGKIDLTRELVDSASPGGDLIALQIMREDWYRQAEIRIYNALNTSQTGTITAGFVPSGAQARLSTTPATNLYADLRKSLAFYANARRRKARNVIAGAAALEHLGGLITDENGDDTALWRVLGARVNGAVNDFATGATDMRVAILGSEDVVNFESPLAQFRFDEQSGPALVTAAIWGYHAVVVARPRGLGSLRFT